MRLLALVPILAILAACADAPPRRDSADPEALLERAIAAAGGERALDRARSLSWEGEAEVHAGTTTIPVWVRTRVRPFASAYSTSWRRDETPPRPRQMRIDATGGELVLPDGTRRPMPEPMLRHERAQFAVYGLMRLLPLREAGVRRAPLPPDAQGRPGIRVEHPLAPPADPHFAPDGRLAVLTNRVPAADGNGEVTQRFLFDGTVEAAGVRWPRRLRIEHDGAPYFELRIERFEVSP